MQSRGRHGILRGDRLALLADTGLQSRPFRAQFLQCSLALGHRHGCRGVIQLDQQFADCHDLALGDIERHDATRPFAAYRNHVGRYAGVVGLGQCELPVDPVTGPRQQQNRGKQRDRKAADATTGARCGGGVCHGCGFSMRGEWRGLADNWSALTRIMSRTP